jgi:hypothetical protein
MLHRQTDVKLRENQENRAHAPAFPKTPKNNVAAPSTHFITPANKPRMALGNKSTNVHHRQPFTSAVKTGKRHSPVTKMTMTIAKPVFKLDVPMQEEVAPVLKAQGGAALREALDRALATGIDVPEPEYAPPPVKEELPFTEPDNVEPMDWPAFHALCKQARDPGRWARPRKQVVHEPMPVFVPIPVVADEEAARSGKAKVANYAAPTASARARSKAAAGKENVVATRSSNKLHTRSQSKSQLMPVKESRPVPSTALRTKAGTPLGPPKAVFHTPADAAFFDFNLDDILG